MHGHEKLGICDAGVEVEVHASEASRVQYRVVPPTAWATRAALAESTPMIPAVRVQSLDHSERAVPSATLSPDGKKLEFCILNIGPRALLSGEKEGGKWQYFLNLSQGSAEIGKVALVEQLITSKVSGKHLEYSHVSLVDAEFSGDAPYAPIREVDLIACPLSKVRLYQAHKQSSLLPQE